MPYLSPYHQPVPNRGNGKITAAGLKIPCFTENCGPKSYGGDTTVRDDDDGLHTLNY